MKLLLVEDSRRLQRSLEAGLRNSGFALDRAFDGRRARRLLLVGGYDVVVLDLMIPGVSGLRLLEYLRSRGNATHVIILSARHRIKDRVRGLNAGADDYLVKPFSFDELVARIHAVSRRPHDTSVGAGSPTVIGKVTLDVVARRLEVDGEALPLTPGEYAPVSLLMRPRGCVHSHERLYPSRRSVTRNAIEAQVSTLRRKLRAAGVDDFVRTRCGFGYVVEP